MTRWTIRISICLLLGAILNVAVAWGIAFRAARAQIESKYIWTSHQFGDTSIEFDDSRSAIYRVSRKTAFGCVRITSQLLLPQSNQRLTDSPHEPGDLLEPWSKVPVRGDFDNYIRGIAQWTELATGWPTLCSWARYGPERWNTSRDGTNTLERTTANTLSFEWPGQKRSGLGTPYIIDVPLAPIFPGFIINTLFYALICFALWFTPGIIRRRIRSARGRCIKCGYDLRGSPDGECPKCGWGREGSPTIESP